ncbi:MAG: hypothetical protein K8S87_02650 [Planctomycetes bacterium]|nr:hypothetical protein [Planctomycetota bacterium]
MIIKEIIQILIQAQKIENEIQTLSEDKDRLPMQLSSTTRRLGEVSNEMNAIETKIKLEQVGIKKCEEEIAGIERRISELQSKQNEAKSNKDYKGFQDAIEKHRRDIDDFEVQQLEHMEKIDTLNGSKPLIKERIEFQEQQLAKKKKELDDNFDNLSKQIDVLKQRKAELFKEIAVDTTEIFDKLIEQRNGQAVVGVDEKRSCIGCHNELNIPTIHQLLATNEIVTCPSCGRILFLPKLFD